jgi:hypothetical protein
VLAGRVPHLSPIFPRDAGHAVARVPADPGNLARCASIPTHSRMCCGISRGVTAVTQGDNVRLRLYSADCIHGLAIKAFRVKALAATIGEPISVEFVLRSMP